MIEEILRRISQGSSSRESLAAQTDAASLLTPREFMELSQRAEVLPITLRPWLQRMATIVASSAPTLRHFQRETIGEGVVRFSGEGGRRAKKLIISFAGFKGVASLPTAVMLQLLPDDLCDLVLLHDSGRDHFLKGIRPHADNFYGLVEFLRRTFRPQAYDRVYCYGASGGGLAALRCALLMKAHRGISASGRIYWHISRLRQEGGTLDSTFDPICHCFADYPVEIVCAYAAGNESDRADAERIARILRVKEMPIAGRAEHNFVWELTMAGKVRPFFEKVFDLPSIESVVDRLVSTVALSSDAGGFSRIGSVRVSSPGVPRGNAGHLPKRR
jgi:hypothetical protein